MIHTIYICSIVVIIICCWTICSDLNDKIHLYRSDLNDKIHLYRAVKHELTSLKIQYEHTQNELKKAWAENKRLIELTFGHPDDCDPSELCAACVYSKPYRIKIGPRSYTEAYFCHKADACKNFVPEVNE